MKRKLRRVMFTVSLILVLSFVSQAQPSPSQFELPCPANTSPLAPNGWTVNPTTGKYRAWVCVDLNGNVLIQGASIPAGGVSGNIQGNDSGTLNGIPGTVSDFVNGLLTIAPTGTGTALTVIGDSGGSNVLQLFSNDLIGTVNFIPGTGTIAVNISDANSNTYIAPGTITMFNNSSLIFQVTPGGSLINTFSILPLATEHSTAFTVTGDLFNSNIQEWFTVLPTVTKVAQLDQAGNLTTASYNTNSNCTSAASPAVCGNAVAGAVAVPTGISPTLTVNTTAVTSVSHISLTIDESLSGLGTCNTSLATLTNPVVTARTPGTSFTFTIGATIATNKACVSYFIVN